MACLNIEGCRSRISCEALSVFYTSPVCQMQVRSRMAPVGQKVRQLLASSVRLPLKMQHTFTCTPHISALEKWSVRFQP